MRNPLGLASSLIYFILVFFHKDRADFCLYFWGMAILFAFYIYDNIYTKSSLKRTLFWTFCFNFLFLFYIPVLSDDVYRFIWDGFITISGQNPYAVLPIDYSGPMISGLFEKLNSQNYFSPYPPLKQYLFAFGNLIGRDSLFVNIVVLRVVLIFSSIINVFLLFWVALELKYTKEKAVQLSSLFALNPFIVIETVGNFHFEGIMFTLLLSGLYIYLKYKNVNLSALFFGMSVSIKLVPLIFLPLIWYRLGLRKGLRFILISLIINLILFIPFYESSLGTNVLKSLDLYFHNFEFNASIYYVFRELGFLITGYNIIAYLGTFLALFSLLFILKLSLSRASLATASLFICFIYLLGGTTIHPWYIITLFGISVFTPYKFPLIWTFVISISYYAYRYNPPQENLVLIFIEYMIVLTVFYWEYKNKKQLI